MPHPPRPVFFVSDGTGITAEALGHSLLTQFEGIEFQQIVEPFVDSVEKARECVDRIAAAKARSGARPIVFCTLVDDDIRGTVRAADALVLDFFEGFLNPLEAELGTRSSHTVGTVARPRQQPGVPGPHRGDQLRARARRRPGQPASSGKPT